MLLVVTGSKYSGKSSIVEYLKRTYEIIFGRQIYVFKSITPGNEISEFRYKPVGDCLYRERKSLGNNMEPVHYKEYYDLVKSSGCIYRKYNVKLEDFNLNEKAYVVDPEIMNSKTDIAVVEMNTTDFLDFFNNVMCKSEKINRNNLIICIVKRPFLKIQVKLISEELTKGIVHDIDSAQEEFLQTESFIESIDEKCYADIIIDSDNGDCLMPSCQQSKLITYYTRMINFLLKDYPTFSLYLHQDIVDCYFDEFSNLFK